MDFEVRVNKTSLEKVRRGPSRSGEALCRRAGCVDMLSNNLATSLSSRSWPTTGSSASVWSLDNAASRWLF